MPNNDIGWGVVPFVPGTVQPTGTIPDHEVHRAVVPAEVTRAARRRLLLELRRCGVSATDVAEWSHTGWWPSLRHEPEILAVREPLRRFERSGDVWGEPQILIRLPDEDDTLLGPPHVDTLPPWAEAEGLRYKRILSVELTNTAPDGGGTMIHAPQDLIPVRQREGDVLSLHPDVPHSGSPNFSGDARMALFFRLMEPV